MMQKQRPLHKYDWLIWRQLFTNCQSLKARSYRLFQIMDSYRNEDNRGQRRETIRQVSPSQELLVRV